MANTQLWLVWRWTHGGEYPMEIIGIFSSEVKAVDACTTPDDGIGPLNLDECIGTDAAEWKGAYYPFAQAVRGA